MSPPLQLLKQCLRLVVPLEKRILNNIEKVGNANAIGTTMVTSPLNNAALR